MPTFDTRLNLNFVKVKRPDITYENVEILDATSEGKGLARINDWVVFVDHAVPGDICNVRLKRRKRNYGEGEIDKMILASPERVEALCEHFGVCGGCKWQNMSYKRQLEFKQKQVQDALIRIGKLNVPEINPVLPSEKTYHYRNRLDFSFSNKRWLTVEEIKTEELYESRNALGFHIPGAFDKVLDIKNCYLQEEPSNSIRNEVKTYAEQNKLSFFNIREREGFLRGLIIRSTSTGEWMVLFSFFNDDKKEIKGLLSHIKNRFPNITSLLYVINSKGNDTIHDLEIQTFSGQSFLTEEMEGIKFRISPKAFYQTNSQQAFSLYKIAREMAELKSTDVVYDLYTGTGTIACFVAKQCKKVVGVEYVEDAVIDARVNAEINSIQNVEFFSGDMKDVLSDSFFEKHGKPDVIITDPPRAGMHEDVCKVILRAEPKRIVYVSCNASTQARDLSILCEHYRITKVQPVDMFPQTAHVENVVCLEKI